MGDQSNYKVLLIDFTEALKERALEAKEERDSQEKDSEDHIFRTGRSLAYWEVVSMLWNRAKNHLVDLADIGLDDIDPDRDLI